MDDTLHIAYTGTEVEVLMLKGILEENGIMAMVRDRFSSSLKAGYVAGTPSSVELIVTGTDLEKAKPLIQEFLNSRIPEGD
jgi:hypothetical protein